MLDSNEADTVCIVDSVPIYRKILWISLIKGSFHLEDPDLYRGQELDPDLDILEDFIGALLGTWLMGLLHLLELCWIHGWCSGGTPSLELCWVHSWWYFFIGTLLGTWLVVLLHLL